MSRNFSNKELIENRMNVYRLLFLVSFIFSINAYGQIEQKRDKTTNKVGFTDSNGEWVIAPQYDEAEDFYELKYAFVKLKNKWGLIDEKGKAVLPFEYEQPANNDGGIYRFVERSGKHGMINLETGIESVACIYDVPLEMQLDAGTLDQVKILAIKDNKAGEIDQAGKVLISCSYDVIEKPFERLESGGIIAYKSNKAGVIDESEQLLIPFVYDEVAMSYSSQSLYHTKNNKRHGLYSTEKKRELVAPVYDELITFDEQYALVNKKKKYGVIDAEGKEVVLCKFTKSEAYEKMSLLEN